MADANIIKVSGFEILEIVRDNIYEYYVKPYDKNDFTYAFGVADRFTVGQLSVLATRGYFEDFE